MSGAANASNKVLFKKLEPKLHSLGKININNIFPKNNSNSKFFEGIMKDKSIKKENFGKRNRISPYKNHFNKSLSSILFNKPNNNNYKKPQKYYIKSPLNFFKNNPSPPKNIDTNKNIPLIPVNMNQNKNNNNKTSNKSQQHSVEYNTINCIINNFNLSCKNGDFKDDKKTKSIGKIKKIYDYDIFNKNNHKIKKNINNLKKNNSMNHYVKNISHLSENNNSNINNLTNLNDESKIEEIIIENQKKELKIQKRNQENKSKLLLIKELERKNQKLKLEYQEIKNKNMEYAKSLERLFKFLKVLKHSGLDISEMMDNISSGEDYDEFDESEEDEKSNSTKKNTKNKKENKTDSSYRSGDSNLISNFNQLSSGLLKSNEKYSKASKLNLNLNKKNIPQLNMGKVQNA